MKEDIRISTEMRSYRECQNCHENEGLWLDAVKGEILSDGSVSDGSGEYLSVCLDCYDEGKS